MSENNYYPSESELEILQVLWEEEPATVRTVHEALAREKDVGYTTTLKQMQRMLEKGVLRRIEKGRVHYYQTAVKGPAVRQSLLQRLLKNAFGGSAVELALHALGQSRPGLEELEELERLIQQKKKEQK
ncbi:MAG: BlaI/MecI/CopY family transcriptional regulator [Lewinellaceae bacterium]|nr:BlaI/MecI/CopY family transcriptional regulator [Lewinellaceae bacterium]